MMVVTNFIKKDNPFEEYASGMIRDQEQQSDSTLSDHVQKYGLNKNEVAPNFELVNLSGETVNLSDYKGKTILLNFWATWCPPCKEEMPILQQYYEDHGAVSEIEIVAVNMTKVEGKVEIIKEFVNEYDLTFPVLLDSKDGKIMDLYEVMAFPTTYIINGDGIVTDKIIYPLNYELIDELMKTGMESK